jgi:hypothetical protein
LYSYEDSVKDNILVSGFTFEQSTSTFGNAAIASDGRSTFRDCIFKVSCLCCCYRGLFTNESEQSKMERDIVSCMVQLLIQKPIPRHSSLKIPSHLITFAIVRKRWYKSLGKPFTRFMAKRALFRLPDSNQLK